MDALSAKVFAMISLFAVVIIFGLLPTKLLSIVRRGQTPGPRTTRSRGEMFVDALNCFGGGVFLATSLLHLLPDVRSAIESILEQNHQATISFPLAEFIACLGFFVIMLLEHLIIQCYRKQPSNREEDSDVEQEARSILPSSLTGSAKDGYGTVPLTNGGTVEKPTDGYSKVKVTENLRVSVDSGVDLLAHTSDDDGHSPSPLPGNAPSDEDVHTLRSLVLLFALSTHTIFEGLAIGLESSAHKVLTLLVAVLIHKSVISFTVGVRFAESMNFRRTVTALLVLSITAPVGVAIGTLVTETGLHSMATDVASAVLQGLATGTFLYVTFFEVLLDQLKDNHSVLKVLACIVGFACITVLELIPED